MLGWIQEALSRKKNELKDGEQSIADEENNDVEDVSNRCTI